MRPLPSVRSRLRLLPFALLATLSLHAGPAAAEPVPPAVAGLLPAGTRLADGSWGVFETEFGKTFGADMRATIPGRPSSCDNTVGPELRVSLKGDTAFEEPPMLDMVIEQYKSEIAGARASLSQRLVNQRSSNSSIRSTSAVQEETLPSGVLIYAEQVEECAAHRGGNTVLYGFARKGATLLELDLFVTAGPAEAVAMAKDMLARFEKLNVKSLLE